MAFRFLSIIPTLENFGTIHCFHPLKTESRNFLEAGEGFGLNILKENCQIVSYSALVETESTCTGPCYVLN